MKDATDFWQAVMSVGYLMEGDVSRETERDRLRHLGQGLNRWLDEHPEIGIDALDHFAMHAVARLLGALSFNDTWAGRVAALVEDEATHH